MSIVDEEHCPSLAANVLTSRLPSRALLLRTNADGFARLEGIPEAARSARARTRSIRDRLVVPSIQVHEIVRAVDALHRIAVKRGVAQVELCLVFRNGESEALQNEPYELYLDDAVESTTGQLDGSGQIKEKVPVTAQRASLVFPERGERYVLALSHLDPLEDESNVFLGSGVAARLSALGYLRAPEEADTEALLHALIDFQRKLMGQAEPSGELDGTTCQKLDEQYGM